MNYRMSIAPAIEVSGKTVNFVYETSEQMLASRDTAADLLLFIQDSMKLMPDYSNIFDLEVKVGGEWEEYEEF
jgi:hypothetical protein